MTRDIQAPFFFGLLLLPVLTAAFSSETSVPTTSGHTSRDTQTSNIQSSPMPSSTDGSAVSATSSSLITHSPASSLVSTPAQTDTSSLTISPTRDHISTSSRTTTGMSSPTTSPASGLATTPVHNGTSSPTTNGTSSPATNGTSFPTTSPASGLATTPVHNGTSSPTTNGTSSPATNGTSSPTTGPASGLATTPVHNGTSSPTTNGTSSPATNGTSSPTTSPASGLVTTPVHVGTSTPATSPASSSTVTPTHMGTSSKATMSPVSKGTPSSVPSNHSDTPTTLASHITRTIANSTNHSIVPPTSSHPKTSQQSSVMVSLIFLYLRITNLQFTSSLEDPTTSYYKDLQRRISELFLQVYKEDGLLGLFYIKFRPGSVLVELILAFQDSAAAHNLKTQFDRLKAEAGTYNLTISEVSVIDAPFPSSAQPGSGVPGWGIALLVLVCILVALAIIYVIALAVCQCRRKNCGQLDIFPTRDAYHPMSEYPTYHTHGRYVPPGSTKRNPYEQVSAGNGGGSLSYSNLAATSANL